MSLIIDSDRILITNSSGAAVLDTNEKLIHIQSQTSFSFTIPQVSAGTSTTETNYLIATIPYSAEFLIGYSTGGYNLNGSHILDFGTIITSSGSLRLTVMRVLSFYVSGKNIYAKVRAFNFSGSAISRRTYTITCYAGNYDA